uniref:Uncharacterized protein n=1 Tax=Aegilops tauschii TaxID=37682 RepID=R7W031_AEGTA
MANARDGCGASLPYEMIIEVLQWLPVKSVYRFWAVCRSWAALLSSDEFRRTHMAAAKATRWWAPPPQMLHISPTATFDSTAVYSCSLSPSSPSGRPRDHGDLLFTIDGARGNCVEVVTPAPCHGLTLLYDALDPAYYICNAATRAATRLPPSTNERASRSAAGLGFDSRSEEYKVVRLINRVFTQKDLVRCEIYTPGGRFRDHWRPPVGGIPSSLHQFVYAAVTNAALNKLPPVFANGCLHFLMKPASFITTPSVAVVSFSVTAETFTCLRSPPFWVPGAEPASRNWSSGEQLVEMDDQLCLVRDTRQTIPSALWRAGGCRTISLVTDEEIALSSDLAKVTGEILLRLLAKSAIHSKFVCKQWFRLIESEKFIQSYFQHKNMDKRPKVMLVVKGTGQLGFSFAPLNKCLQEAPSNTRLLDTKVVCSKPCHGLNLISTETKDYLCNPCTVGNRNVGLTFDPSTHQHVIVAIFYRRKDFKSRQYDLTCTLCWCNSGDPAQLNSVPPLPVNDMPPAYVDGMLYWMNESRLGQSCEWAILSFNLATRTFDVVLCPSWFARWNSINRCLAFVVELEGLLCAVLADPVANRLDVWKLEHGQWGRTYTIHLEACPDYSLKTSVVVPLAVDPDYGRILLNTGRKIGLYDPVNQTIQSLYSLDQAPVPFVPMLYEESLAYYSHPVANKLDVWKLEHGQWGIAYTIHLKACPDYSLKTTVVVPLAVDPDYGRILLNTGRKVGLYSLKTTLLEAQANE